MNSSRLFMAFDFGERRTGIALGQEITLSAQPLSTIATAGSQPDWQEIEKLLEKWQPSELIVGIPAECEENKTIRDKIIKFSTELSRRFNLPVQLHDETLTSDEAYRYLKAKRIQGKGKINKSDIDQYAAAILLESWMSTTLNNKQ